MDKDTASSRRGWQVAAVLALLTSGVIGCVSSSVPGYQLRAVPRGFLFTANVTPGTTPLPDREMLSHGVWLGDIVTFEPQSTIDVTRYAGAVSIEESRAVRDAQASKYGRPASIDYGEVETVTIDGRPAFAWMETRYDEHGAVRSMEYQAVIPTDTVSYLVAFSTSAAPRLHPDSLTRVVQSWGPGRTEVLWGPITVAVALLIGLAALLVYKARG
jgi:hypothetical protein